MGKKERAARTTYEKVVGGMKYQANVDGAIKTILEEFEITQAQMAEECGMSHQAISSWRHGRTQPSLDKIIQLCDYYGMEISEWVKEVNIKNQWR